MMNTHDVTFFHIKLLYFTGPSVWIVQNGETYFRGLNNRNMKSSNTIDNLISNPKFLWFSSLCDDDDVSLDAVNLDGLLRCG